MLTDKFDILQFCGPCVVSIENKNVTDTQRELLICHCKLGISMYHIQELMKYQTMEYPNGNKVFLPPVIFPKLISTSK